MSAIENILTRMMNDPIFAEAVFIDASTALAEYKLSADQISRFKDMSRAEFESMSTEDRISLAVGNKEPASVVYPDLTVTIAQSD